jgi:hypothetical protein
MPDSGPQAARLCGTLPLVARDDLADLIAAGALTVGTTLHHHGRSAARRHVTATVVDAGLRYGDRIYRTPSAAARAITGRPVDGWHFWKLPTGERLQDLRTRHASIQPRR